MNVEPDSRICFEKAQISDWATWTRDDGLEPFQHGVKHGGKGELELFVNRMLSRAFFAYLHLDKLLEVLVCIHGKKKSLQAKL